MDSGTTVFKGHTQIFQKIHTKYTFFNDYAFIKVLDAFKNVLSAYKNVLKTILLTQFEDSKAKYQHDHIVTTSCIYVKYCQDRWSMCSLNARYAKQEILDSQDERSL